MKFKALLLSTVLVGTLAACGTNDQAAKDKTEDTAKTEKTEKTDVVTTASIVDNADALVKAASAEGNWIFAILNDVTMDKELVVDGEFHDKGDAANPIYRKFAPYTQDTDHNITATLH